MVVHLFLEVVIFLQEENYTYYIPVLVGFIRRLIQLLRQTHFLLWNTLSLGSVYRLLLTDENKYRVYVVVWVGGVRPKN